MKREKRQYDACYYEIAGDLTDYDKSLLEE